MMSDAMTGESRTEIIDMRVMYESLFSDMLDLIR